jgi:Xaa-Pro aminopeptidase
MGVIKAGVHWDDVHLLMHRVIIRGLLRLGILTAPRPHIKSFCELCKMLPEQQSST